MQGEPLRASVGMIGPMPDAFRPDPVLYPDIAQAGDLRSALQAEFGTAGLAARVEHVSSPGWRHVAAEVRDAHRHAEAVMDGQERAFCLQFWTRCVLIASGTTTDLDHGR
jgi:hypothetical protein